MHIPDGILEVEVWGTATILVGAVMYKGVNYSKKYGKVYGSSYGGNGSLYFCISND